MKRDIPRKYYTDLLLFNYQILAIFLFVIIYMPDFSRINVIGDFEEILGIDTRYGTTEGLITDKSDCSKSYEGEVECYFYFTYKVEGKEYSNFAIRQRNEAFVGDTIKIDYYLNSPTISSFGSESIKSNHYGGPIFILAVLALVLFSVSYIRKFRTSLKLLLSGLPAYARISNFKDIEKKYLKNKPATIELAFITESGDKLFVLVKAYSIARIEDINKVPILYDEKEPSKIQALELLPVTMKNYINNNKEMFTKST